MYAGYFSKAWSLKTLASSKELSYNTQLDLIFSRSVRQRNLQYFSSCFWKIWALSQILRYTLSTASPSLLRVVTRFRCDSIKQNEFKADKQVLVGYLSCYCACHDCISNILCHVAVSYDFDHISILSFHIGACFDICAHSRSSSCVENCHLILHSARLEPTSISSF